MYLIINDTQAGKALGRIDEKDGTIVGDTDYIKKFAQMYTKDADFDAIKFFAHFRNRVDMFVSYQLFDDDDTPHRH